MTKSPFMRKVFIAGPIVFTAILFALMAYGLIKGGPKRFSGTATVTSKHLVEAGYGGALYRLYVRTSTGEETSVKVTKALYDKVEVGTRIKRKPGEVRIYIVNE